MKRTNNLIASIIETLEMLRHLTGWGLIVFGFWLLFHSLTMDRGMDLPVTQDGISVLWFSHIVMFIGAVLTMRGEK